MKTLAGTAKSFGRQEYGDRWVEILGDSSGAVGFLLLLVLRVPIRICGWALDGLEHVAAFGHHSVYGQR
jgi:hypothetical protein